MEILSHVYSRFCSYVPCMTRCSAYKLKHCLPKAFSYLDLGSIHAFLLRGGLVQIGAGPPKRMRKKGVDHACQNVFIGRNGSQTQRLSVANNYKIGKKLNNTVRRSGNS